MVLGTWITAMLVSATQAMFATNTTIIIQVGIGLHQSLRFGTPSHPVVQGRPPGRRPVQPATPRAPGPPKWCLGGTWMTLM